MLIYLNFVNISLFIWVSQPGEHRSTDVSLGNVIIFVTALLLMLQKLHSSFIVIKEF